MSEGCYDKIRLHIVHVHITTWTVPPPQQHVRHVLCATHSLPQCHWLALFPVFPVRTLHCSAARASRLIHHYDSAHRHHHCDHHHHHYRHHHHRHSHHHYHLSYYDHDDDDRHHHHWRFTCPGRLHFVGWCRVFVGPGTCFMLRFWRQEFWGGFYIFGIFFAIIIIIIIIIITTTIIIISFMQGIYPYISETNYVPREYSVAAFLLVLFMVLISLVPVLNLLYFYISTFRSSVQCPIWLYSVVPWLHIFLVCCSRIFWMTLK